MLTFDDGPHSSLTNKILDILEAKKVKATFFVYGSKVVGNKDVVTRMHAHGHEIANHGWSHTPFTKQVPEALEKMIRQTTTVLNNITKGTTGSSTAAGTNSAAGLPSAVPGSMAASNYIRPPLGNTNAQVNDHIMKTLGLRVALWSLDSKDYQAKTAKEVSDTVLSKAKPGDIVLFHDVFPVTVEALPEIIDQLYVKGYEFLTLAQVTAFPDDSPK
jgi:peptidoglycan/xylan/chitin deacetylase (PgdA/CDA1 family)